MGERKYLALANENGEVELPSSVVSVSAAYAAGKLEIELIPSGGDDAAAINKALEEASRVTLHSPAGGYFKLTAGPIVMPSNRTLVLKDAEVRREYDGKPEGESNTQMIVNSNPNATGNENIFVAGIGRAIFNGQDSLQKAGQTYLNIGLLFVNVKGLSVEDVAIGPCHGKAANMQKCSKAYWSGINLLQEAATLRDGIDVGPGCSNIVIDGVRGRTGDDCFSIYAQNTSTSITPYLKELTAAERNIKGVYITDVAVECLANLFRLQAGDKSSLEGVFGSNLRLTNTSSPCNLIGADDHFQSVSVKNVTLTEDWVAFASSTAERVEGFSPEANHLVFENIYTVPSSGQSFGNALLELAYGAFTNITVRSCEITRVKKLLNNTATISQLHVHDIWVGATEEIPFSSAKAETGSMDDVVIETNAGAHTYGYALSLKLGPNVPTFISTDTTPSATIKGSKIICDHTKDPTGGGGKEGGEYIANGSAWVKIVGLGEAF
jgi:polygalacturonase